MGLARKDWGLLVAIGMVIGLALLADPQRTYWVNPQESAVDIVRQVTMLGLFAMGSALVIIAGGIDLSSGSVIAFSGTICATLMLVLAPEAMESPRDPQVSLAVMAAAIAGTIVVGFLVGSLHAWLITVVGLPPFVATLASLVGLRSLARAIIPQVTEAITGRASNQIQIFDSRFRYLANSVWIPFVVFVVLAIVLSFLLGRTVIGRHLYALGGNEEAARLSGIRTDRLKWLAYSISAMLSSVAGIFFIGEQSVADPQVLGMGYELNAIAAAVVGGCSLQGGVGTIPGTVLGCVFLRTVMDGIAKVIKRGADVYEGCIVGILVVLAVAMSQFRQTSGQRREMLPDALGWVMIPTLALLGGAISTFLIGPRWGLAVAAILASGLLGTKVRELAQARQS